MLIETKHPSSSSGLRSADVQPRKNKNAREKNAQREEKRRHGHPQLYTDETRRDKSICTRTPRVCVSFPKRIKQHVTRNRFSRFVRVRRVPGDGGKRRRGGSIYICTRRDSGGPAIGGNTAV